MPRLKNSFPNNRKHKQSGQAIVTLSGRDFLLGPHGTQASRLEYDRLIMEWLASGRSRSFGTTAETMSITELVVDYAEYVKSYCGSRPNSELHRIPSVLRPVRRLYGKTLATEFGVLQFKAIRQSLIDKGLSRSFINASMRRLVRMFRWAVTEGRLTPDVPQWLAMVPGLRRGKTTARETDPVMPVDDALLDATLPLPSRHWPIWFTFNGLPPVGRQKFA